MVIRRQKVDRKVSSTLDAGHVIDFPPGWSFTIDCQHHGQFTFNFDHYRKHGRDEIAGQMRDALWSMRYELLGVSLKNLERGVNIFWRFLDELHATGESITQLADVDRKLLDRYLAWLELQIITLGKRKGNLWSNNVKRALFNSLKSLLVNRQKRAPGFVSHELDFPRNPFPNSNKLSKNRDAYSSEEQKRIIDALNIDLRTIHEKNGSLLNPIQILTVHLLLLAIATGRNLQSLLDLRRDSLRPHPLGDRELLVTTKRRGWSTHATSVCRSMEDSRNIHAIPANIGEHFRFLCDFTSAISKEATSDDRDFVFLVKVSMHKRNGQVVRIKSRYVPKYAQAFSRRHNLLDDRGQPLSLVVARLRPTFANELYRRTRDIRAVQQALGHASIDTTARNYVDARLEGERDHTFVVDSMVSHFSRTEVAGKVLLAADGKIPLEDIKDLLSSGYSTGIARCKNPFRDGESVCKKYFACFRCPSMCVFEDDLWRLFSFYYRLLSERAKIDFTHWMKTYGPIIRRIDADIASQFSSEVVAAARLKAQSTPHPAWRDPLL